MNMLYGLSFLNGYCKYIKNYTTIRNPDAKFHTINACVIVHIMHYAHAVKQLLGAAIEKTIPLAHNLIFTYSYVHNITYRYTYIILQQTHISVTRFI